jgi:outer membrane murein-binding lipoprotein Lpp
MTPTDGLVLVSRTVTTRTHNGLGGKKETVTTEVFSRPESSEVGRLADEIHQLRLEVRAMDAKTQAAFDKQNAKLDEVASEITSTLTTEIDEVKALVAALPGTNSDEVVAAAEAVTTRLDNLKTAVKTSIGGISDAVFPPATP